MDSIEHDKNKLLAILNDMKLESELIHTEQREFYQLNRSSLPLYIYFDYPYFIEFSSSASLFVRWFHFASKSNVELTNIIRTIFRKIALEYGIKELIYFSEWFFELDEIRNKKVTFDDFLLRMESNPHLKKDELLDINSNE